MCVCVHEKKERVIHVIVHETIDCITWLFHALCCCLWLYPLCTSSTVCTVSCAQHGSQSCPQFCHLLPRSWVIWGFSTSQVMSLISTDTPCCESCHKSSLYHLDLLSCGHLCSSAGVVEAPSSAGSCRASFENHYDDRWSRHAAF